MKIGLEFVVYMRMSHPVGQQHITHQNESRTSGGHQIHYETLKKVEKHSIFIKTLQYTCIQDCAISLKPACANNVVIKFCVT